MGDQTFFARIQDAKRLSKKGNEINLIKLFIQLPTIHSRAHATRTINETTYSWSTKATWLKLQGFKNLAKLNHELDSLVPRLHIILIFDLIYDLIFQRLFRTVMNHVFSIESFAVIIWSWLEHIRHNFSVISRDQLIYNTNRLIINVSGHHTVSQVL